MGPETRRRTGRQSTRGCCRRRGSVRASTVRACSTTEKGRWLYLYVTQKRRKVIASTIFHSVAVLRVKSALMVSSWGLPVSESPPFFALSSDCRRAIVEVAASCVWGERLGLRPEYLWACGGCLAGVLAGILLVPTAQGVRALREAGSDVFCRCTCLKRRRAPIESFEVERWPGSSGSSSDASSERSRRVSRFASVHSPRRR
jgi:hypothetical protein